jgi:hypothetical protein
VPFFVSAPQIETVSDADGGQWRALAEVVLFVWKLLLAGGARL